MSDLLTYSAEGVARLVIESLGGDAVLRGLPDASVIEATIIGRAEFLPEGDVLRLRGRAERVVLPEGLSVTVEDARGNLRVQGLTGSIELGEVRGDLRLDRLSGDVTLTVADGDIRADGVARLTLHHDCSGDLRFVGGGALVCESVGGDLRINDSASLSAGDIHGDLWVERLTGALSVRRGGGDARLSDVGGPVTFDQIAGDLRGAAVVGGLAAAAVHGDAILHGPYAGEAGYSVTADGDISLHLSAVDEVRLTVRAAGRIRADVPLTPTADGSPTYTATVGSGATRVTASAGGDLRIARAGGQGAGWERKRGGERDAFSDLSGLGERIRQQVASSLANAGIALDGEINLGRRGERRGRAMPPAPPAPPAPPKPPKRSAEGLTSEQLAVLKMVEEGRITPEEADKLLAALGR